MMSTVRTKEEDCLLIYGYIRIQNISKIEIPTDIKELFIQFHHEEFRRLKFSKKFVCNEKGYEFSEDNKCVKRCDPSGMNWILVDDEPVKQGIHCWRIQVISYLHTLNILNI